MPTLIIQNMTEAARESEGSPELQSQSDDSLPEAITSAVLETLIRKKSPAGYKNLGLGRHYPRGFFEAVEALTFVTDPSWQRALVGEFTKEYFAEFWLSICKLYVQNTVVSPLSRRLLFNAFNLTPLDKVKVVIPAIAPLHGLGYTSDGLAFSALPGDNKEPPPCGVFKLLSFVDPPPCYSPANLGSLRGWAEQGVLLWNMTLTSQPDKSTASHQNIEMHLTRPIREEFYLGVAEILKRQCDHLVFLLFQVKSHGVYKQLHHLLSPEGDHSIVKGPALKALDHPLTKVKDPMWCFREVNSKLEALGKTPIDWLAL